MAYKRETINNDIERDIITGLIVDSIYCREALKMLRPEHFQSKHLRRVNGWIKDYYDQYQRAPLSDIRTIFSAEQEALKEEEADLIEILLEGISEQYQERMLDGSGTFNIDYLLDSTRKYLEFRNLSMLRDKIELHLSRGEIDRAKDFVRSYGEVAVTTSKWINPFDEAEIRKTFYENYLDELFTMPGLIGELTGPIERGWFVGFLGPGKRGKSWYLQDLDVEALAAGLKVAHISLEMAGKTVKQRVYAKLTARVKAKWVGDVIYPIFDCLNNQNGSCQFAERKSEVSLMAPGSPTPKYDRNDFPDYQPCTYCRAKRSKNYIPAVWYTIHQAKEIDSGSVIKKVQDFKRLFSDNFRVISYPPYGRSMSEIIDDIKDLRTTEGFIPDLISIDYIDITAPEKGVLSERGQIDTKWKMGKGMATDGHCCVATVSQSGRASFDKEDLDEADVSEDIRKFAHVDIMYGLNQSRDEKELGIMRFSLMAYRHDEFSIKKKVMVLQSLKIGQPFLDSEYDPKSYESVYGLPAERRRQRDQARAQREQRRQENRQRPRQQRNR